MDGRKEVMVAGVGSEACHMSCLISKLNENKHAPDKTSAQLKDIFSNLSCSMIASPFVFPFRVRFAVPFYVPFLVYLCVPFVDPFGVPFVVPFCMPFFVPFGVPHVVHFGMPFFVPCGVPFSLYCSFRSGPFFLFFWFCYCSIWCALKWFYHQFSFF